MFGVCSHLEADHPHRALKDAKATITLAPNWHRGYYRKGMAQLKLDRPSHALAAFKDGLEVEPDSSELKNMLATTQHAINQLARNEAARQEPTDEDICRRLLEKVQLMLRLASSDSVGR